MVRNVSVFQKIAAGTLLVVTIFRFFFSPSEFKSFDEKVHSLKFSPMHVLYDTQRQRSRCVFFFFSTLSIEIDKCFQRTLAHAHPAVVPFLHDYLPYLLHLELGSKAFNVRYSECH
jgi:hypothetical protein